METRKARDYAWAVGAAVACTLAGRAISPPLDAVNVAMVYLLGVVVIAQRVGRGPAITCALLGVIAFDVLFVPPVGALRVEDAQYVVTFAIMLVVALVISELAERGRREGEARERLAVQAESERIRGTLLASISHDLRTPLAVLSGAASSLAQQWERLGEAERRALAATLDREVAAMAGHVGKVLQMTRLESGAAIPVRDWASIPEITAAVIERLGPRLARHRLVLDLPADLPLVRVDESLVEAAIANLLENAALHTPPGTVVHVRGRAGADSIEVTVEDFGGGVADGDLERVFAKFERGDMEAGGGMGLGLAICRAIVALHGGRTWAERVPAGGMAFRFTLPLEAAPRVPAEPVNA
jgi:two-component system sensor histidine kinase KdpD